MKKLLVFALMLLAVNASAADVIPSLRAPNAGGTMMELREVRVLKVEPDGIRVMHSMGMAKIPYESLPEELRAKYGISSSSAQKHREETQAAATEAAPLKDSPAKVSATPAAATASATKTASKGGITKEDVKRAWLAQYDPNLVCPQSPGGAAKRASLARQSDLIRSGAWDAKAEEYARQANARNGTTAANP